MAKYIYTLITFLSTLTSCCPPKDKILLGKYFAAHGKYNEHIILLKDGTYWHIVDGNGYNYKKQGTWDYGFDHCNFYLNNYANVVSYYDDDIVDSTQTGTNTYLYSNGTLEKQVSYLSYIHESKRE